jgi:hypothetical protein
MPIGVLVVAFVALAVAAPMVEAIQWGFLAVTIALLLFRVYQAFKKE